MQIAGEAQRTRLMYGAPIDEESTSKTQTNKQKTHDKQETSRNNKQQQIYKNKKHKQQQKQINTHNK